MSYRLHRLRELSEVMPAIERALDLYEQVAREEATRGHFAATRDRIELLQERTAAIVERVQVELLEKHNGGRHETRPVASQPGKRRLRVSPPAARGCA